jgi:hypothetical protein
MGNVGKVENLGGDAQKKVIKLSVEGMSNQAIADELNKDFNSDLNSEDIRNYLRRNQKDSMMLLKEDKNFQGKLTNEYFDTITQLKALNSELWKFFYELRANPEYKDKIITCGKCKHRMVLNQQSYGLLLKTADTILNQVRHVDAVLGKLQKKSFNVTYNYTDLSKKIAIALPTLLHQMEQRGIVKVHKKRLKLYQGGKKMEFKDDDNITEDDILDDEDIEEIELE